MPKVEDRKLTPKENYMRVMRGEMPEWVPIYTFGAPLEGEQPPMAIVKPLILDEPPMALTPTDAEVVKDLWGVGWIRNEQSSSGFISDPNNLVLEDIEDWHDVVHAPDISDVDWEDMCRKTLAASPYNREQTGLVLTLSGVGGFQQLVALMGFEGALIAIFEEPEESAACMKYINDWYIEVGKHCMEYLKPDIVYLPADDCNAKSSFMSEDLWRQTILPTYIDTYKALGEPYDLPLQLHECGAAANLVEILNEEAGVTGWESAQWAPVNDLHAFKEKMGRKVALIGAYDYTAPDVVAVDCSDEAIIESVYECVDEFAPDGGFIFMGMFVGPSDDPRYMHKNAVMYKAAQERCNSFYDEKLVPAMA